LVNKIGIYLLVSVIGTFVSALMMGFMLKPYVEETDEVVAVNA
jgi:hypothetical protein